MFRPYKAFSSYLPVNVWYNSYELDYVWVSLNILMSNQINAKK